MQSSVLKITVGLLMAKKGLYIEEDKIIISKIFKWFKGDFAKVGGKYPSIITLTFYLSFFPPSALHK